MTTSLSVFRLMHALVLSILALGDPMMTSALAQPLPDTGGRVFGLVGGSFGDGGSAVLTSAGAGLRMTRTLGLDLEVFHVSGLELSDDDFFIQTLSFAPPFGFEREGGVTGFLAKIVADFPVGDRVIPFVSGGGGVSRVTEELSFDFDDRPGGGFFGLPELFQNGGGDLRPSIFPRDFETAETGLAFTLGGGVDIRLWKGFTVGGEARWLRVLAGTRSIDLAHIGSRVAYRF
jgi:opacity protein-like surface antigen